MKNRKNSKILKYMLTCTLLLLFAASKAQSSKGVNSLVPMSIVDKRGGPINKTIGGMDAMVNNTVTCGIKYLDGCSTESAGNYKGEFNWYDSNNETGKFLFDMVKESASIEQQKNSFFGQSNFDLSKSKSEDFAGGDLRYITESKACINEITGATGKTEYSTQAKYFGFIGNTIIKIDFSSKINSETVKTTIANIVGEAKKFDFALYKSTVLQESE